MPESSARKRCQIHLSTAIVMMFVAGGLTWANVRESKFDLLFEAGLITVVATRRGWPYWFFSEDAVVSTMERARIIYWVPAVVDLLVAILVLFAVLFVCECWIRRRAARKGV